MFVLKEILQLIFSHNFTNFERYLKECFLDFFKINLVILIKSKIIIEKLFEKIKNEKDIDIY